MLTIQVVILRVWFWILSICFSSISVCVRVRLTPWLGVQVPIFFMMSLCLLSRSSWKLVRKPLLSKENSPVRPTYSVFF